MDPGKIELAKFAHLLARLAYEDGFRQRFLGDPDSTLRDMGIDPTTADLPKPPFELPSQESLQKTYEERFKREEHRMTAPWQGLF